MSWEDVLRTRLNEFSRQDGTLPISIKIRSDGGAFDRSGSPNAFQIMEELFHKHRDHFHRNFHIVPHESGPELIAYFALATASLTLGKSVIDLVTTIIKARSEGQKKGDYYKQPLELIVRGFDKDGKIFEERVLKVNALEEPARAKVEKALMDGIEKHLGDAVKGKPKKEESNPRKSKKKRK